MLSMSPMRCCLELSRPAQKSAILLLGYKMAMAVVWRYHVPRKRRVSNGKTRLSLSRPIYFCGLFLLHTVSTGGTATATSQPLGLPSARRVREGARQRWDMVCLWLDGERPAAGLRAVGRAGEREGRNMNYLRTLSFIPIPLLFPT